MTLSADEFIRRFLLHVLPDGFHRIRYYGFLGNRHRQEKLERCRQLLGMASADQTTPATEPPKDYRDRYEQLTGVSLRLCPVCRQGRMIRRRTAHRRLHILNLGGHFMRTPGSQPLSLPTCPRQVRGEVSGDVLQMCPHSFVHAQCPIDPRSSVTRHSAITRLRHRTIAFAASILTIQYP